MAPRIGVTTAARPPEQYRRALVAQGAEVLVIGTGTEAGAAAVSDPAGALAGVDGLLLTGGLDIEPSLYGEPECHATVRLEVERDRLELPLCRLALARAIPVLGICRGVQVLNVACGGRLWQDLSGLRPATGLHMEVADGRDRRRYLHVATAIDGTRTAELIGTEPLPVNSIHHQAVREVGVGLRIAAVAPDGVIEAIEGLRAPFFLGVQWHPEELWERDARQAAIFQGLCRAAVRYHLTA